MHGVMRKGLNKYLAGSFGGACACCGAPAAGPRLEQDLAAGPAPRSRAAFPRSLPPALTLDPTLDPRMCVQRGAPPFGFPFSLCMHPGFRLHVHTHTLPGPCGRQRSVVTLAHLVAHDLSMGYDFGLVLFKFTFSPGETKVATIKLLAPSKLLLWLSQHLQVAMCHSSGDKWLCVLLRTHLRPVLL